MSLRWTTVLSCLLLFGLFSSVAYAGDNGSCGTDESGTTEVFKVTEVSVNSTNLRVRLNLDDGFSRLYYVVDAGAQARDLYERIALTAIENDLDVQVKWQGGNGGVPGECNRFVQRLTILRTGKNEISSPEEPRP